MEKYDKKFIIERPWGYMERFTHNETSTVKLIYVKPGEENSLQYHNKRAEFWKIIKGPAKVVIGDKTIKAQEGEEFFIPPKVLHRYGAYDTPATILEIAFGYQDEEDIVRLEDKYNRIDKSES